MATPRFLQATPAESSTPVPAAALPDASSSISTPQPSDALVLAPPEPPSPAGSGLSVALEAELDAFINEEGVESEVTSPTPRPSVADAETLPPVPEHGTDCEARPEESTESTDTTDRQVSQVQSMKSHQKFPDYLNFITRDTLPSNARPAEIVALGWTVLRVFPCLFAMFGLVASSSCWQSVFKLLKLQLYLYVRVLRVSFHFQL